VEKESFSRDHRMVFFAGLEGTGHHMWHSIMSALSNSNIVHVNKELSQAWFTFTGGDGVDVQAVSTNKQYPEFCISSSNVVL
jgi:hypothetical protein